jgi:transposase
VPVTHWSAHLLGVHVRSQGLAMSDRTVSRILYDADLQPHRQQMWLTSHDDEFRAKRDDVLRVYYDSPRNEHIVCVDEKTGMQALQRRYTDTPMGAFDVRRGKPFGFTSHQHDSDTFIELLDVIDAVYPAGRGHIIMDNLSAHDTPDVNEWFDEHPRWTRHFTPKHASWLNQIECWFSILGRHVLARGSFTSQDDLAAKVDAYVEWYLKTDQPFRWTYRPKSWRRDRPTSGARNERSHDAANAAARIERAAAKAGLSASRALRAA